jgi:hypothetical protein
MTPSQAAARSRAAIAPASAPAPLRQPLAPRRVSGPTRHPRALPRPRSSRGPIGRLLDAPVLDRLIRGRIWIALIASALLGIVAMQVAILRLGASIGHSVDQIAALAAANQAAETAIAQHEPGRNVAAEASSLGMVYPPDGNVVYLSYGTGDAAHAAGSLTLPTAPLFTPAAATLTAPIQPALSVAATSAPTASNTTSTSAVQSTGTSPGNSTSSTTSTTSTTQTPPATQSGGSVSSGASAPSTSTDLGAGGGSAAPGG